MSSSTKGLSKKNYISKGLICFLFLFGITSWASAQNNGRGRQGNPDEGAPQARNQRWVKEGTDILYAFPIDTKVGIGLANPAYSLEVAGYARFHGQVGLDTDLLLQGNLRFSNSIWTSEGFVGIGTVNPQYNLDVTGTSHFDGAAQFLQQVLFNGLTEFNNTSSFNTEVYLPGSGVWNSGGQVGIGTTTPSYMLEVAGTTRFQEKALFGSDAEFTGAVTAKDQLRVEGATNLSGAATLNSSLSVSGTSIFEGSGTFNGKVTFPQGIWTSQGQLGIGTKNPESMLDVAGSIAVQGPAAFENSGSFAGDVAVGQKLSVSGASRFTANSQFDGEVQFGSNVNFTSGLGLPGGVWNVGGQVGIGTVNPQASLDVAGVARFQKMVNFRQGGNFSGPLTVGQTLDVAGASTFSGNSAFASDVTVGGAAQFDDEVRFVNGVWSSDGRMVIGGTIAAEDYRLQVQGKLDTDELFLNGVPVKEAVAIWQEQNSGDIIFTEGNVGIGTAVPDSTYKLSVSGRIRSKEVVVEADWADFVFEDDYRLPSLKEVEQFINANGHLRGIPTAEEVEQDGIALGAIQAKLLQKIEELTLYMIKLKEENREIKQQLNRVIGNSN